MNHIEIGGEKRPIWYNINALILFEELTGLDFTEDKDREKIHKLKNVRALAFAGLREGFIEENKGKDFPFTIEDVGKWIDPSNRSEIYNAFSSDTSPSEQSAEGTESKKSVGATSEV